MATARVLGSEPNVYFAAFDAADAVQKITSIRVQAAQTDIGLILTGTVETAALGDFISAPLKAATQGSPTTGDAHDKLLDALKRNLTSTQIGTLTTALAGNQTTDAIKQTVASMKGGGVSTPVAPVANAGAGQSVIAGTTVTLDASTSSATAGKSLTYAWTLTSKPAGSSATLAAPTSAKPTFVTDVAGSYVASVIVNDGTTASSAAAVTITASVANAAPVANAGVAQNVVTGTVVTLDGSASSDANGDSLTYAWTLTAKPAGSSAALSSPTSRKPTFTADAAGTYVGTLTVNDGKVSSTAATVNITAAVANVAPVANAGVAQKIWVGSFVTLDGGASSDANGDSLTYSWSLISKPSGSAATLTGATSTISTFTVDLVGTYVASLVVNDGKVNSSASTIAAQASKPIFTYTSGSYMSTIVNQFTQNEDTGLLSKVKSINVNFIPGSITFDKSKNIQYITNFKANTIETFSIDKYTGDLSKINSNAGCIELNSTIDALVLKIDPTNRFLYLSCQAINNFSSTYKTIISTFSIDALTNAVTQTSSITPVGNDTNFALHPNGTYLYSTSSSKNTVSGYFIDQNSGALSVFDSVAVGANPGAVTVSLNGKFLYTTNNNNSITIFSIDQATGKLTNIGYSYTGTSAAAGSQPRSLVIHPSGNFAYTGNYASGNISVFNIDPETGLLSSGTSVVASTTLFPGVASISIDPAGKFLYAMTEIHGIWIFSINQMTGALTEITREYPSTDTSIKFSTP